MLLNSILQIVNEPHLMYFMAACGVPNMPPWPLSHLVIGI